MFGILMSQSPDLACSSVASQARSSLVATSRMLVAASIAGVALAFPAAGSAHLRAGTVAVDYRATLERPVTAAYRARIFQSDRGLSITVARGHSLTLLGYLDEPVFRLDRAGLEINLASPTAAAVGVLKRSQLRPPGTPRWRLEPGRDSVAWHDVRSSRLPSGEKRGTWQVPLIVDGHRARLIGELQRVAAPSIVPWLAVAAVLVLAALAPLASARMTDPALATMAIVLALIAVSASVLVTISFALDQYASPGTWIAGLDEIAFAAIGVGVLARGPSNIHVGAAVGLGLLSLAIGISKGAVFLHPIVLAILPATLVRVLILTAVGGGASAATLGGAYYVRVSDRAPTAIGHGAIG
jgi:hypothetical protein